MRNINHKLLEQFNIECQFEFYVKNSALKKIDDTKPKTIPSAVWKEFGHLMEKKASHSPALNRETQSYKYFIKKLKNAYPDEEFSDLKMSRDNYNINTAIATSLKIELKSSSGELAQEKLKKIITLLQGSEYITNKKCDLNFNISFKDTEKNNKNLAYDILQFIDIHKILDNFDRSRSINSHFKPNEQIKLGYEEDVFHKSFKQMLNTTKSVSIGEFRDNLKSLSNPKKLAQFMMMVEENLKIASLKLWKDDQTIISHYQKNGIESLDFYATGGPDYPHKMDAIMGALNQYVTGMTKAHELQVKNQAVKKSLKMA